MNRVIILIVMCCVASPAMAADWYLDSGASGTNAGTSWTNAWETTGDIAWGSVSAGDTIHISGGASTKAYSGGLTIGASGTEGSPITVQIGQTAGHNGMAIITGQLSFGSYTDITIDGNYNSTISIRFTGSTSSGVNATKPHRLTMTYLDIYNNGDGANEHGIRLMPPSSPSTDRAVGTTISYSTIRSNYQDGINYVRGNCVNFNELIIHDNIIELNGDDGMEIHCALAYNNIIRNRVDTGASSHADGIQGVKGHWKIYNNEIYDFDNAGIFIESTASTVDSVYIYNNLIYLDDKVPSYTRGIQLKAAGTFGTVTWDDVKIYGNVIANFDDYIGLRFSKDALVSTLVFTNTDVRNNIFYNNQDHSTWYAGVTHDYNWFSTDIDGSETNGVDGNADDPFTDYASNDFTLSAGSTPIDAGSTLGGIYSTDYLDVSRPSGSSYDIGAYEYVSGGGNGGGASYHKAFKGGSFTGGSMK